MLYRILLASFLTFLLGWGILLRAEVHNKSLFLSLWSKEASLGRKTFYVLAGPYVVIAFYVSMWVLQGLSKSAQWLDARTYYLLRKYYGR